MHYLGNIEQRMANVSGPLMIWLQISTKRSRYEQIIVIFAYALYRNLIQLFFSYPPAPLP